MTSFPSMRVAMPTASSTGGNAPRSGSICGVSGIECVSPSSMAGVEGATSVGALLGSATVGGVAEKETPNCTTRR